MSPVKKMVVGLFLLLVTCLSVTPLWATDVQKLIADTQHVDQGDGHFSLVWWIPNEFWSMQGMSQEDVTSLLNAVGDYTVICVVDAEMTSMGSVIPLSREQLLPRLSLRFADGTVLKPLADSEISSDALNFFAMMKPLMGNMLGQFGQGMEFVCFKGGDGHGNRRPNPLNTGNFSLDIGAKAYDFKLPLGSLLPLKMDPVSREEFPGDYLFNPYTGKKLIVQ